MREVTVRHWKRFAVSPEGLLYIHQDRAFEIVENALPRDARVAQVYIDQDRYEIVVVVEHKSFPGVSDTEPIPWVESVRVRELPRGET